MPQAGPCENLVRRKMEIKSGRGHFLFAARLVMKKHARIGLVRPLIFGEAHVAINPKHRTAARARVGVVVAADCPKVRREIADEAEHRVAHLSLEARLIGLKPFASIVPGQLAKKLEETLLEVAVVGFQSTLPSNLGERASTKPFRFLPQRFEFR